MRTLNRKFRDKDRPTDVLSFETFQPVFPHFLGDVVISVDTAEKQARQMKHSLEREITVLLVHGIVHLLGFDHEKSDKEHERMSKVEKAVLDKLEKSRVLTKKKRG